MAVISPFSALRFNQAKVKNVADVLAPPYDHIDPNLQERLLQRHPHNIVRLTPTRHELEKAGAAALAPRVASTLAQWRQDEILMQDRDPALYYCRMGYSLPDGQRSVRKNFFALLDLEPDGSGVVLPNENDWMTPRSDRSPLLEQTKTFCIPIFLLFDDPDREVMSLITGAAAREAIIDAEEEDGPEHDLYRVTDTEAIKQVRRLMAARTVTMADGHHRYRTAQAYAAVHPEQAGAKKILACFVPIQDEGLYLQPIHRAVSGMPPRRPDDLLFELSKTFYIRELDEHVQPHEQVNNALQAMAEEAEDEEPAIVMGIKGFPNLLLLTVKSDAAKLALPEGLAAPIRDLDVALLHRLILEGTLGLDPQKPDQGRVLFFDDPQNLPHLLSSDEAQLAFLCNPLRLDQLQSVSEARLKLPHKAARFLPDVYAGLVLQPFS